MRIRRHLRHLPDPQVALRAEPHGLWSLARKSRLTGPRRFHHDRSGAGVGVTTPPKEI